jgi:hypothetical protein
MFVRNLGIITAIFISGACDGATPFDPSEFDCAQDYSYEQIGLWERTNFHQVGAVAGVSFTDFDEVKVCLAVGVVAWSVVPAVEAKLQELGIPRGAVYIRVEAYAIPAGLRQHRLR